ncbi:unnamed protein product [Lactuca virosa]|uniref:Protein kinase domain-containing protein n=1 Tax=Lactuca virosa TaxID=75947 RepID=A0AAU9NFN9_9ASTR|nr:unnamed protein product [Lactuca virosa]
MPVNTKYPDVACDLTQAILAFFDSDADDSFSPIADVGELHLHRRFPRQSPLGCNPPPPSSIVNPVGQVQISSTIANEVHRKNHRRVLHKFCVEVSIVVKIVHKLYEEWQQSKKKLSIGVISPYAAQVVSIEEKLCYNQSFQEDKNHISTGITGTLGYMAPEYILNGKLTEKVDVYSFGVLLLEVVTGISNRRIQTSEDTHSLLWITWCCYVHGSNNWCLCTHLVCYKI